MLRTFAAIAAAAAAAVIAPTATAQGIQRHQIVDLDSFGQPVPAFSFEMPADWEVEGAIRMNPSQPCETLQRVTQWQARNDQGTDIVALYPAETWMWSSLYDEMPQIARSSFQGCPVARIGSIGEFFEMRLRQGRPGATIVSTRPRPDVVRKVRSDAQPYMQAFGMNPSIEAYEAQVTFEEGGRTVHEVVILTGMILRQAQPHPAGYGQAEVLSGITGGFLVATSYDGPVDMAVVDRALLSGQPNPEYDRMMIEKQKAKIRASQQAQLRAAAARRNNGSGGGGGTMASGGSDILDSSHESFMRRNGMSDTGQASTIGGINETTTYQNVWGEDVTVSGHHDRAFRMDDGSITTTDDAFANPWGGEEIDQ